VGAELLPQALVPALPQQVLVELADRRQEPVGSSMVKVPVS